MEKTYEELEKEYELLKEKIKLAQFKKEQLDSIPIMKHYHSLINDLYLDKKNLDMIATELQIKKMKECKHLFIETNRDYDYFNDNFYPSNYYCIKCGLYSRYNHYECINSLYSSVVSAMPKIYDKTKDNNIGIINGCLCDKVEGIYIYDGIIKKHKNINDVDLLKYFKAALYNRNKKKGKILKYEL